MPGRRLRLRTTTAATTAATPPDYEQALAGAPAPLAALHAQANELLDGGAGGLRAPPRGAARLSGRRQQVGLVVRAVPASSSRSSSASRPSCGKRVAFLGVDSEDSEDAAASSSASSRSPIPSFFDPDQEIAAVIKATLGFPTTAFYDRGGELVYTKQGGYAEPGGAGGRHPRATRCGR